MKNFIKNIMNILKIDGKSFSVSGKNIRVKQRNVYVDGDLVTTIEGEAKTIHVEFQGDLAELDCNTCTINGNVQGSVDANTINCKDVGGNIDANTVNCGKVNGDIDANVVNSN